MQATSRRIIGQGVMAGVIGFVTIALLFALVNIVSGRSPFYTSALLGATLFHGATDPAQVAVTPQNVLAYSGLHLLVFLAFGALAAALAALADRGSHLWYVSLFFFVFVTFHLEGVVQSFAYPMREALSAAAIWGAGFAASAAMLGFLIWRHPRIRTRQAW